MFEIFRFLSKAQNDKGAPSLRVVFTKTAWQSKKAFEEAFERACVPLGAGGDTLSAFFCA